MNKRIVFAVLLSMLGVGVYAEQTQVAPEPVLSISDEGIETSAWTLSAQPGALQPQDPLIVEASIVGRDDRQEITGRATGYDRGSVVLSTKYRKGGSGCSGSMISPNAVLTAAHCIFKDGEYAQRVEVYAVGLPHDSGNGQTIIPRTPEIPGRERPTLPPNLQDLLRNQKRSGGTSYPGTGIERLKQRLISKVTRAQADDDGLSNQLRNKFGGVSMKGIPMATATKMWAATEYRRLGGRNYTNEAIKYDYAVIILDKPLGNQTGYYGMTSRGHNALRNARIDVIGRGGDKPLSTLWKSAGRVGKVQPRVILHNADTKGGNSGGCIVTQDNPGYIIALNNYHHIPADPESMKRQQSPEGTYPNGGLLLTDKIIREVLDVIAK